MVRRTENFLFSFYDVRHVFAFYLCDKTPEIRNLNGGKVLFGLTVGFLVGWAGCILAYSNTAYLGGKHVEEQSAYVMVAEEGT